MNEVDCSADYEGIKEREKEIRERKREGNKSTCRH